MAGSGQSPRLRVHEIDFVRGAALFGILVVNIFYYGLPIEIAGESPRSMTALAVRLGRR